jgi:cell division protein FtsB
MQGISKLAFGLRRMAPQVVIFCVLFYFAYHAIEGERGWSAWGRLEGEALENRVWRLRKGSLDGDLLEEQARRLLNLGHENDLMVLRPDRQKP